jgi:6-phosphogluconolactonase
MKNFELISFPNADALARAAADGWLKEVEAANRAGRLHHVALSGGRITQKFFAAVVDLAKERPLSFDPVHFFWADERCVPPADSESNFRMAQQLLFAPLKIAKDRIHRIRGEDPPDFAASAAEAEILRVVPTTEVRVTFEAPAGGPPEIRAVQPKLDLVFLGLGEDGHVASLFPSEPEDTMMDPAVFRSVSNSPKPPPSRITLGYWPLFTARQIWMLASGAGKEVALQQSLSLDGPTPFGRVLRGRPSTRILTDIPVA